MFEGIKPRPTIKPQGDGCKIKIKQNARGKEISFEGKCSREEVEMAKEHVNN